MLRSYWALGVLPCLTCIACRPSAGGAVGEARADPRSSRPAANGVAVVELFTSEGCSSCPPADEALAEVTAGNPAVYALSFHVDYWDDLGWPDRFAAPEYTARQQAYSRSLGSGSLFTPQMVVNGFDSFVGSDRSRLARGLASALSRAAPVPLSIHVRTAEPGTVVVDYAAPGAPADTLIVVAVLEHSAATDVRAGENAGRRLHHRNVVRGYFAGPAERSGSVQVQAATAVGDGEVIAYLQHPAGDRGGLPVLGAARAPLL
jgi:hypothetical protein